MDTNPSGPGLSGGPLRTPEELFALPQCTHIVTMNNPGQNVHIERIAGGFQMTFGSLDPHPPMFEYGSLDELYRAEDAIHPRQNWRDAIWQDISDYPPFSYGVDYRLLDGPIQLDIVPDSEHATAHGPHAVYGPVDITPTQTSFYLLTPTAGWLVIEYPTYTMRGRGGRLILRSTRNFAERLRLNIENYRLRHDKRMWTHVRPGVTIVYGKPPADWQSTRQLFTAERAEVSGGHG